MQINDQVRFEFKSKSNVSNRWYGKCILSENTLLINLILYRKFSINYLISLICIFLLSGDYFVCNDNPLGLIHSHCTVLSFGVNRNDRFEEDIHKRLNCVIHSFDPFVEPMRVTKIRNDINTTFKNSTSVKVANQWFFHSLGLSSQKKVTTQHFSSQMKSFGSILEYTNLSGKVIDVLKLDTEGAEWDFLEDMMLTPTEHPNLLCKFVKQLVFEAHPWLNSHAYNYHLVRSLECCFRLFRRDHRFFVELEKTEWQLDEFQLDLSLFKDEIDLAHFLFTYGELYFINLNYLKSLN